MSNIFMHEGQWGQLQNPQVGQTGSRPFRVKDQTQQSQTYTDFLRGAGILGALRAAKGGNLMNAAMSATGFGAMGLADYAFNPAGTEAQINADQRWVENARMNDDPRPFRFRHSSAPPVRDSELMCADNAGEHLLEKVVDAALVFHRAKHNGVDLVPLHKSSTRNQKVSAQTGAVKLSSPMEKRANYAAIVREAMGKTPYSLPGEATEGWASRLRGALPPGLGGPSRTERILDKLKEFVVKDEVITNANGIATRNRKVFLPGMMGKLVRLPLAVGALAGVNYGAQGLIDWNRRRKADSRFNAAVDHIRNDETMRDLSEYLDPETEMGQMFLPKIREGFDIIDKYAPTAADDPRLAAQFLETFARGTPERPGLTNAEYMQQVREATALNREISNARNPLQSVGGALSTFLAPDRV